MPACGEEEGLSGEEDGMREHRLRLEKFGISADRYRELLYLCRQYDEMRRRVQRIREGTDEIVRRPGNSAASVKDPTGNRAVRAAASKEARRIKAIEDAAAAADPQLARFIILNVSRGVTWEHMSVPCGRRQFYETRRRFFWELAQKI